MGLAEDRESMIEALQRLAVPRLRELGFQGSFPHFRRPLADRTDLASFHFDRHGGGFAVELARAPGGGPDDPVATYTGERVPPAKLRAADVPPHERLRLGARRPGGDHWFRYDRGWLRRRPSFDELAEAVRTLLDEQAEPWWGAP